MIAIPNTLQELRNLEKENNVIVKFNPTGKMTGMYPAFRKVAKWVGYKDEWEVYYIAAKLYPVLLDLKIKSTIMGDEMMGKLKETYKDEFGREVRICKTEKEAIEYLKVA